MRTNEFIKRRLRQLIREELERTDLKALVYDALAPMDLEAIVQEVLRDESYRQTEQRRTSTLVLH